MLGAGQMGAGIAQVAAAGHDVVMADVSREVAEKASVGMARRLTSILEKGKMNRATVDAILGRVRPVASAFDGKKPRESRAPCPRISRKVPRPG